MAGVSRLAFLLEAYVLIVKVPDVTTNHVFRLDREVRFLPHFVQLERGGLGRLWEDLSLPLMMVDEDQEDIFPRGQAGSKDTLIQ